MILSLYIGGMYVADWEEVQSTFATSVYAKAEKLRAKRSYELLRTSGYPSMAEALHLVEDGNVSRMPASTCEDIHRAY